jgi:hypothetical protein
VDDDDDGTTTTTSSTREYQVNGTVGDCGCCCCMDIMETNNCKQLTDNIMTQKHTGMTVHDDDDDDDE